jgi:hypothetical protein
MQWCLQDSRLMRRGGDLAVARAGLVHLVQVRGMENDDSSRCLRLAKVLPTRLDVYGLCGPTNRIIACIATWRRPYSLRLPLLVLGSQWIEMASRSGTANTLPSWRVRLEVHFSETRWPSMEAARSNSWRVGAPQELRFNSRSRVRAGWLFWSTDSTSVRRARSCLIRARSIFGECKSRCKTGGTKFLTHFQRPVWPLISSIGDSS